MQHGIGGLVGEHRHGAQHHQAGQVGDRRYLQAGTPQQGHRLVTSVVAGVGRPADGEAGGGGVVQGQVEQHQVAQAVFPGALAGQAAIGQRQGGIAHLDQAAAGALGHGDAALAQALDQRLHHPQVAFDDAGIDDGGAVQFGWLRAFGAFGIAIEALAGLAPEAACVHQFFLHQRRLEAEIAIECIEDRTGNGVIDVVPDQVG
ncbi:hypothetical protein D3C76_844540 [compost metagenome]